MPPGLPAQVVLRLTGMGLSLPFTEEKRRNRIDKEGGTRLSVNLQSDGGAILQSVWCSYKNIYILGNYIQFIYRNYLWEQPKLPNQVVK